MYRKRMGVTSIIETIFVILVSGILSVGALHLNNVLYVARAKNVIDYIEKQDSMWREIRDMGYGIFSGASKVRILRYNNSCQEVDPEDPTAVTLFDTVTGSKLIIQLWETYTINCLYAILGILPREIGIKVGKSLNAMTIDVASQLWDPVGVRRANIWIGEYEFSPNGVKGFDVYALILKSNTTRGRARGDVFDAYFFDQKMNSDRQLIHITATKTTANGEISRTCEGSCKARTNISGKLIHFIEIKGKDSLVSRRYAHCSYNDNGCAMPKSAFTGLTVNTGIGPIENMTGSSCGNRKSTKNECILVTRRMEELAPWEDWNTIDNW